MEAANQCDVDDFYEKLNNFNDATLNLLGGREAVKKIKNIVPVNIRDNSVIMVGNVHDINFFKDKLKEIQEHCNIESFKHYDGKTVIPLFHLKFKYPLLESKILKSIYK